MTDRIAATFGPASALPKWIRFLRLGATVHNRKNWLFFGSDTGRRIAVLNRLITTCKRLRVDAFAYLRGVFARISAHPHNRLE
jgi:hypothetical protein